MSATVAELKSRMGQGEFVQWRALYQTEGFGHFRSDLQTAMLATLIANANRDPKRRPEAYKLDDFLPDWWQERQPDSGSLMQKFMAISQVINADHERNRNAGGEAGR